MRKVADPVIQLEGRRSSETSLSRKEEALTFNMMYYLF
jgi:hypothetical protein